VFSQPQQVSDESNHRLASGLIQCQERAAWNLDPDNRRATRLHKSGAQYAALLKHQMPPLKVALVAALSQAKAGDKWRMGSVTHALTIGE